MLQTVNAMSLPLNEIRIEPTLFCRYKWLDGRYVGAGAKIVTKKLILDQFVMTPPVYVIFYASMSLMEGKSDLLAECKQKFIPTFLVRNFSLIDTYLIKFYLLLLSSSVVKVPTYL